MIRLIFLFLILSSFLSVTASAITNPTSVPDKHRNHVKLEQKSNHLPESIEGLPVHLFVVRASYLKTVNAPLGEAWNARTRVKLQDQVLPGQFSFVDFVFVPIVEGTPSFKEFARVYSETNSTLRAVPLRKGEYFIWDTADSSLEPYRLTIPSEEASKSPYVLEEIEAAINNGKIFYEAVADDKNIKVLPTIYGAALKEGPITYSYTLRPFVPADMSPKNIRPLKSLLSSEKEIHDLAKKSSISEERWTEMYLGSFGKMVATLNYSFGIFPQLLPQNIDVELDSKNGTVKAFIIKATKNVTIDNFARLNLDKVTVRSGRRTPQINRFHYYDRQLSQPGANLAAFVAQSLENPVLKTSRAEDVFLSSYLGEANSTQGLQLGAFEKNSFEQSIQKIHNAFVDAKRPLLTDKMKGLNSRVLEAIFQNKYKSSQVCMLDYHPDKFVGNWDLLIKEMKNEIGYTYSFDTKTIVAYDKKTDRSLAFAYDVNDEIRTRLTAKPSRLSFFKTLWSRIQLLMSLASGR